MVLQALCFGLEANSLTACMQQNHPANWTGHLMEDVKKLLQMLSSAEDGCYSESEGGLHHHGFLQHACKKCVWGESSL